MLFVFLACNETGLQTVPDKTDGAQDTALPLQSGALPAGDSADSGPAKDSPAPECPELILTWESPVLPEEIAIDGELSANGVVFSPWVERARDAGTARIAWSIPVCERPLVFRGQGAALWGGERLVWSCQNDGSSKEEPFEKIGTFTCSFDGIAGTPVITPAPLSEGCELTCTFG